MLYDFGAVPPAGVAGVSGLAGSVDDGLDEDAAGDGVDDGVAVDDDSLDDVVDGVEGDAAGGVVAGVAVEDVPGDDVVAGELPLVLAGDGVLELLQPATSAHAVISIA